MRHYFRIRLLHGLWLALITSVAPGCSLPAGLLRSRWAMEDPEYAQKYADGADKSDIPGKIKQAADARFLDGATGFYVSGGALSRPDSDRGMLGGEIGYEGYATSFLTARGSLMGIGNQEDWFTGLDGGLRLQSPTRLAAFTGAGVFVGAANEMVPATDDSIDNDDDGFVDEAGEKRERLSGMLVGIYPEVGAHFWWTPAVRLTGYGKYMVTSEGRSGDDWLIGAGIAIFSNK